MVVSERSQNRPRVASECEIYASDVCTAKGSETKLRAEHITCCCMLVLLEILSDIFLLLLFFHLLLFINKSSFNFMRYLWWQPCRRVCKCVLSTQRIAHLMRNGRKIHIRGENVKSETHWLTHCCRRAHSRAPYFLHPRWARHYYSNHLFRKMYVLFGDPYRTSSIPHTCTSIAKIVYILE